MKFCCTWGVLFLTMLLGKFEMIFYCLVGNFYLKAIQWKRKMTIEFCYFSVSDFTLLSKLSCHCWSKICQIFMRLVLKRRNFFPTRGNSCRVFSSIIQILNFSSQPIFRSVRKESNLIHGNIQNWNHVSDLYLKLKNRLCALLATITFSVSFSEPPLSLCFVVHTLSQ